jgi:hypothetical protein
MLSKKAMAARIFSDLATDGALLRVVNVAVSELELDKTILGAGNESFAIWLLVSLNQAWSTSISAEELELGRSLQSRVFASACGLPLLSACLRL